MFSERGLAEIGVECEVPFVEGGSPGAEFMLLTFDQINERAGGTLLDAETVARCAGGPAPGGAGQGIW
jgi:hypothetical protein